MNCQEFLEKISIPESLADIEQDVSATVHLEICPSCRKKYELQKKIVEGFAGIGERPTPASLTKRVMDIPGNESNATKKPIWGQQWFKIAFSSVFAVVILYFSFFKPYFSGRTKSRVPPRPPPQEAVEEAPPLPSEDEAKDAATNEGVQTAKNEESGEQPSSPSAEAPAADKLVEQTTGKETGGGLDLRAPATVQAIKPGGDESPKEVVPSPPKQEPQVIAQTNNEAKDESSSKTQLALAVTPKSGSPGTPGAKPSPSGGLSEPAPAPSKPKEPKEADTPQMVVGEPLGETKSGEEPTQKVEKPSPRENKADKNLAVLPSQPPKALESPKESQVLAKPGQVKVVEAKPLHDETKEIKVPKPSKSEAEIAPIASKKVVSPPIVIAKKPESSKREETHPEIQSTPQFGASKTSEGKPKDQVKPQPIADKPALDLKVKEPKKIEAKKPLKPIQKEPSEEKRGVNFSERYKMARMGKLKSPVSEKALEIYAPPPDSLSPAVTSYLDKVPETPKFEVFQKPPEQEKKLPEIPTGDLESGISRPQPTSESEKLAFAPAIKSDDRSRSQRSLAVSPPIVEERRAKIEDLLNLHSTKVVEGPIDLNQWVLDKWITLRERIMLAPPPNLRWKSNLRSGKFEVSLEPSPMDEGEN